MTTTASSRVKIDVGKVVLQKYRVEYVLGEGGMGVVLAVRHTELGVLFAMKLLVQDAAEHGGAVERFLSEARSAARIVSDHVARVYDVGKLDDGSPYMLMEHLEGVDLASLLETDGAISACDAIDYVLQALDGISEAHALGIIHRDLKPANLFLAKRPSGHSSVKVLDFGISQDVDRKGPSLTHSGSLVGTPYYMSPEQMRSAKELDARCDIWALGVVLYELLTDTVPFPGASVTEVCSHVLEGEPAPILSLAPATPPRLVEIVKRCLARQPDQRYQTAKELAAALRDLRTDLGEAPGALRPRNALDSFTGPHWIGIAGRKGATTADDIEKERETAPAPTPTPQPTPKPLPSITAPLPPPPAMTSQLANSVAHSVASTPANDVSHSTEKTRASGLTMTGWSDASSRRHQRGHMFVFAALGVPLLLIGLFLGIRGVFAPAATASAMDQSSGAPPSAVSIALVGPVISALTTHAPKAPQVTLVDTATPAATPSSSPRAELPPTVPSTMPKMSSPIPTPSSPALTFSSHPIQPVLPRKHEGIY